MRKVVSALIHGETDADELLLLVHKRIRNKHTDRIIRDSLIGVISVADRDMLHMDMQEVELFESQIEECKNRMLSICQEHYQTEMQLPETIPGIKAQSAMSIISEAGVDMKAFLTASALVGWAGLRPRNDESAGKIKARKTLHGNKYLRVMPVQCAWGASRTKESKFYSRYNTFRKRMNHNKALVANARKLLVIIWNILEKKQSYTPLAA